MKTRFAAAALLALAACKPSVPEQDFGPDADAQGHSAASAITASRNAALADSLPPADTGDFEQARRGLIATPEALTVRREDGRTVWDQTAYRYIDGAAPPSVNPSLWRQAQLNDIHGLFQVSEGIYQLRGFDLANMTLIRGQTGWIVVDPLTVAETAAVAMQFARAHLDAAPIRAILFTHSHVDHFGGVEGVLAGQDAADLRIIAPAGFLDEAVSENVMAGIGMNRRAGYMYGRDLARSPRGHVDTGLGKEPPRSGHIGIRAPTETISHSGQRLTIDGVEFEFMDVSGSEAPAEFAFYLPQQRAFCGAELGSRSLHNLYTLRGAKVRDALAWSNFIDAALQDYGTRAEIYFGSHQWPIWGQNAIRAFLVQQRDTYKYIHDQTLRLANLGQTPREIAEQLQLPDALRKSFSSRDYYGTVSHNAKAVYQFYFGWYDGNPANLNPLPPAEAGARYVALAGGAAAMLAQAQQAYDAGDYRWSAELLNHLVFAQPDDGAARALLARTYDQLGYQAESGPWRDSYLSAANELRHGVTTRPTDLKDFIGLLREIPRAKFFDSMAARLNGPKADGVQLTINFRFTDLGEDYVLDIGNSVLHHHARAPDPDADATLSLSHEMFLKLATDSVKLKDLLTSDEIDVSGNPLQLARFFSLFDKPDGRFNIVTP